MKQAVLLVDHGSRRREAHAVLDALAAAVRERLPERVVAIAHMEIAEPSVAQGIATCVAQGARDICLVPCFLAPGTHAARDIPRLAREAAAGQGPVRVRVAAALGAHPGVVEAVLARLAEAQAAGDGSAP